MKLRNKKTGVLSYMMEARISFMDNNYKSYWYDSLYDFCKDWEIVDEKEEE